MVPGGRFREMYYWDTYWVIRGLIQCQMLATVKGILENFVWLIKRFGMIPNGTRAYYTGRSQPPLFIQMVKDYLDASEDADFVRNHLKYFEQEYSYWTKSHQITVYQPDGEEHKMFRYILFNDNNQFCFGI